MPLLLKPQALWKAGAPGLTRSVKAYTFLALMVLATYFTGPVLSGGSPSYRLIGADTLVLSLLGFGALFLQSRAGFPLFVDPEVRTDQRVWWPMLAGVLFGLADILVFEWLLPHEPYTNLPPFTQPFPYSVLLYGSGALHVELMYRLIPLTLGGLLIRRFCNNRLGVVLFWILVALCALIEPLEQLHQGVPWLVAYSLISGFAFNFLLGWWLQKAGFLAAWFMRMGHYLLWHILMGAYIQYVVLAG